MSYPPSAHVRMPKRLPYSLGFKRYALYFDGDDYVEAPDDPSLNPTRVTVEALVKPRAVDGQHFILSKYSWANIRGYALLVFDGKVYWRVFGKGVRTQVISSATVSADKWYFIQATFDGDVARLYINGALDNYSSAHLEGEPTVPLRVGYASDAELGRAYYFDGVIALARVYERGLADRERQYNMLNYHDPVREGLVLWYDLEEGRGDKAYDKSGQGNHGTIYGATWVRVRQYELRAEVGL